MPPWSQARSFFAEFLLSSVKDLLGSESKLTREKQRATVPPRHKAHSVPRCIVNEKLDLVVVRSPFRAKHHVVVQYIAAGWKCPLPPSPTPHPSPPLLRLDPRGQTPLRQHGWWKTRRTRKNWWTRENWWHYRRRKGLCAARDFALQLPWALLLVLFSNQIQSLYFHLFENTSAFCLANWPVTITTTGTQSPISARFVRPDRSWLLGRQSFSPPFAFG